jgi:AraC-like DNA-binding protein
MSQVLMQKCVESEDIQKYIHHFGVKIHNVYPILLDIEDAQNELWLAVFRAINERYREEKSLIIFAKRAVFSRYGTMIKNDGNAARTMNEIAGKNLFYSNKLTSHHSFCDRVETEFTLDQIEKDLNERASSSRQYRYAVKMMVLLRKGATFKDCCQRLHISKTYVYTIFHEIIRECGGKYREETITKR